MRNTKSNEPKKLSIDEIEKQKLDKEKRKVQLEKEDIIRKGGNLDFINQFAPSEIDFTPDDYVKTSSGYSSGIQVIELPDYVDYFWMRDLSKYSNTLFTLSLASGDKSKAIKEANKAYQEYSLRIGKVSSPEKEIEARENAELMWNQIKTYRKNNVSLKRAILRIRLFSNTLEDLRKERDKILSELLDKGYKAVVYSMYQKEEFEALSLPLSMQTHLSKPLELKTDNLGYGSPFEKVDLLDPSGSYIAYTESGLVLFDFHHIDDERKSATGVIFGQPGSGKSALTKQIIEAELAKENKIRLVVISKEYDNIIQHYGGQRINIFGEENRINPFQIFATVTDDDGNILEYGCFTAHLAKLGTMFEMLEPTIKSSDKAVLNTLLILFYQNKNILKFIDSKQKNIEPVTIFENEQYPTASEFYSFLQNNIATLKRALPNQNIDGSISKISTVLSTMTGIYANIFEGHTLLNYDDDSLLVCYDMRQKDVASKEVLNCQFYSALMTIWKEAINNGVVEKDNYTYKRKNIEDITRFTVIMDEVQNYLNADMGYAVQIIINFIKEMRKLFAGIIMITPSAQHFFPSGNSSPWAKDMEQIFHLCTYKFFFKANEGDIQQYAKIFNNAMNERRLSSLVRFKVGDAYLVIGDNKTLRIRTQHDVNKEVLYSGGV